MRLRITLSLIRIQAVCIWHFGCAKRLRVKAENVHILQLVAAEALGIQANKVIVRVKRLGGGFGGKETRSIMFSTVAAVAANK